LAQALPGQFTYPIFWPRSFAFDKRFNQIARPVYLVGYWQSEKYFAWNRERLLKDLWLVDTIPTNVSRILKTIQTTRSVALHVRRGDYVSNPAAAKFHGLCTKTYYQKAVAALKAKYADIQVFSFSDEPDWVRANLRLTAPMHVVDASPSGQAHIDLELMRHCQHHIIANSSFSWWGAWLCEKPEQVVHAPERWFADVGTDTSDLVPSRWVKG
jgi:hypothetical protein